MGRKGRARATKGEITSPTSAPKSPPQVSDNSRSFTKRKKTPTTMHVRRSQRIHNTTRNQEVHNTTTNQEIEPVVQEINISESEKENEQPLHEENKSPEETSDETERSSERDNPGVGNVRYKSMYINSQKKIEALVEENKQLSKSLEHVLGKVDVYEKQTRVYSEVMAVIASLSKVNENLSAQMNHGDNNRS